MSADFLVESIRVPAQQKSVDVDKMLAAYDAAPIEEFHFFEPIGDVLDQVFDDSYSLLVEDPESITKEEAELIIRKHFRESVVELAEVINNVPDDAARINVTEDFDIIVTGGFSYGDSPTETFDVLMNTHQLPESVFLAF